MVKISSLGEFGLINRIAKKAGKPSSKVMISIGDDAAVLKTSLDKYQIITTDTMVENVHFSLKYFKWWQLGWKILAVNISDIVAMGGLPNYALVTLGLSKKVKVEQVDDLYHGMQRLAKRYKVQIIGGDIVSSPNIFVTVALLGEVEKKYLLRRSGAKAGDLICVTGVLGGSAAGLRNVKLEIRNEKLVKKHLLPEPKVKEGRLIAKSRLASAMIDNSDGLVRSVLEICKASGVGAKIFRDKIPVAKGATLKDALFGGEDYGLVFTAKALRLRSGQARAKAKVIGVIVPKSRGITVDGKPLKKFGWEHF